MIDQLNTHVTSGDVISGDVTPILPNLVSPPTSFFRTCALTLVLKSCCLSGARAGSQGQLLSA